MISSSWQPLAPDIDAFLTEYERENPDAPGTQFADQFLATDPARALVLSREALLAALPARRKMFDQAGIGPIRRVAATQLELDATHLLVTSDWAADRADAEPLMLESTFLIRRDGDDLSILVYLNHNDIMELLTRKS